MGTSAEQVALGFTDGRYPAGVHICHFFTTDTERRAALEAFIAAGLRADEQVACFSDAMDTATLDAHLDAHALSGPHARATGQLTLQAATDVYFADAHFEPEHMLALLKAFDASAHDAGRSAARVIGEMDAAVTDIAGGDRLLEYEARVTLLLRDHPVTSVCQYDARRFDGATLMDILKVHPMMVMHGKVVHNPFFIAPETLLPR